MQNSFLFPDDNDNATTNEFLLVREHTQPARTDLPDRTDGRIKGVNERFSQLLLGLQGQQPCTPCLCLWLAAVLLHRKALGHEPFQVDLLVQPSRKVLPSP
eukprot:3682953-Rhodomonas_salina.4